VTQLQWQSPSDVPQTFLEDLTTEVSPAAQLAERGWSLTGAALREDPTGELALDLICCAMNTKHAYKGGQDSQAPNSCPTQKGCVLIGSGPVDSRSNSHGKAACSSNIILNTCTTPGAVSAYRRFFQNAPGSYSGAGRSLGD